MNKFWFVAINEYKRHVFSKGFIWAILSVPLILSLSIGAGFLAESLERNNAPLGYVDLSGELKDPQPVPEGLGSKNPVEIIAYPDEETAQAALDGEKIQAYYVLEQDYLETRATTLYYYDPPGDNAGTHFRAFIQANLILELPPEVAYRALDGLDVITRTPDGSRELSEKEILNIALPIAAGFVFMFLLMTSSGYLAGAVAEEKENRTMEILATSMSTNQFITGKVVGILCISLTQLTIWILFGIAAIQVGGNVLEVTWMQNTDINLDVVLLIMTILIPAYIMYAALTLMISGTVTSPSEGQQLSGMFAMPLGFSYWLAVVIIQNPNGPLSTALSMFPFTAPTLMPLRAAFSIVPTEQIIITAGITMIFAAIAIWLAARAFDLGMLRYGQKLSLRDLFKKTA